MSIKLLVVALAAVFTLTLAPAAYPATNIQTPTKAYKVARVCLLQHGARYVDGNSHGGSVFFKGVDHVQFWRYHTWLGLVDKVTVYAFPGLPAQKKREFVACVMKGN